MMAQIHVCAAKAGVDMIAELSRAGVGRGGSRVNPLWCPDRSGAPKVWRVLLPAESIRGKKSWTVFRLDVSGRRRILATPVCFSLPDLAGFITGAVIPVDGGWAQITAAA